MNAPNPLDEGLPTEIRINECFDETDINQSSILPTSPEPESVCGDLTIGDISVLIDYLLIRGPSVVILPNCM